jgi:hypothetical protein
MYPCYSSTFRLEGWGIMVYLLLLLDVFGGTFDGDWHPVVRLDEG